MAEFNLPIDKFIFDIRLTEQHMADAMSTYAITIGIFVFLVGVLFATRARRGHGSEAREIQHPSESS
ncbi:MAG TPA: hypothetical protein VHA09_00660 [Nitrososphaera sp.]|nr:hypothetical protein [Nitrososphaera sp.]